MCLVDVRGVNAFVMMLVMQPSSCARRSSLHSTASCVAVLLVLVTSALRHAQEISVRLYVLSYIRILLVGALITANLCIIALLNRR